MAEGRLYSTRIHRVVDAHLLDRYVIRLVFQDGTERVIDFEPILLGPLFGPLRDPELFGQFTLDELFGSIEWPTGADIDPTVLHDWPDHVAAIVDRQSQAVKAG
jgi:hypothetical protein